MRNKLRVKTYSPNLLNAGWVFQQRFGISLREIEQYCNSAYSIDVNPLAQLRKRLEHKVNIIFTYLPKGCQPDRQDDNLVIHYNSSDGEFHSCDVQFFLHKHDPIKDKFQALLLA